MPEPQDNETREEFVKRCVPLVIEDGTAEDGEQAVAVCNSMWEQAKEGKAMSLDDLIRQVRDSWYSQFRRRLENAPTPVDTADEAWVREVFDEYVIIESPAGLFQYPYEQTEEGITFGEPQKVEIDYKPSTKSLAVKMLSEDESGAVVGGQLLLWGDAEHKDLQGEYFTPDTELWLERYKSAPALFHHGLDETVGLAVIGHRTKAEPNETGVWVEDWLDKSSKYWALVKPLLDAEALYYSPGSAPHLVKTADDGRLLSFPPIEDTLTVIPAQHRLRPVGQIKAAYKAANLEPPEIGTDTGSDDAPSGDTEGSVCEDAPDGNEIERLRAVNQNRLAMIHLEE